MNEAKKSSLSTAVSKSLPETAASGADPHNPVADDRIALPAMNLRSPRQTTLEGRARMIQRLDWGLAVVVLLLAFLVASFTVRNTDFWQHLASGRLYAHGQFHFGVDPFTYTAAKSYWANHSWLYDWIQYQVTLWAGGPDTCRGGAALVILKALLISAVAWCMLRTHRIGQSLWAPAVCSVLALVTMGPRLLYQPTLVSLLFLSLTVYLVERWSHEESEGFQRKRFLLAPYGTIVPLFVLWVNVDGWFILGPLTVALFLVGQFAERPFGPAGERALKRRHLISLTRVLVVGSAACLLNPHHYRAFILPALISQVTPVDVYDRDSTFRQLFNSSWNRGFLQDYGEIAGSSYFLLMALGLLSFMLTFFRGWRWWRLLVWMAFALLAAYRVRCIPFFAVVAAPITALNLQDFASARFGRLPRVEPLWTTWSLGGRVVTILAGLVLLLAAWPGWLQGRLGDSRQRFHVHWAVEVDPSMRRTAEQLRTWRIAGLLPATDNGFNYGPDLLHYCCWFCTDQKGLPLEKGFFDFRIELFPDAVAREYLELRKAWRTLRASLPGASRDTDWQAILRQRGIGHVLLPQNDALWLQFLNDWDQWSLVRQDGKSCVFCWLDPERRDQPDGSRPSRFDPNSLAFGPRPDRAPLEGPDQALHVQDLYARYLYGAPIPSLEAEQAGRHLEYFNLIKGGRWPLAALLASQFGLSTGMVATAPACAASATATAPIVCATRPVSVQALFFNNQILKDFLVDQDLGPAAAPLLAVRAARRAIKAHPEDAQAYLNLAKAYDVLLTFQETHWANQPAAQELIARQRLRQVQIAAALERAVKLRPEDADVHELLFRVYTLARYQDLALEHLREVDRCLQAAGPRPGDTQESVAHRKAAVERTRKSLEIQVARARTEYEVGATNQPLLYKARLALSKQLGKKALDLLLEADPTTMEIPAAGLQLFLLLATGRSDEARSRLEEPESRQGIKQGLGANYDWYVLLLEAADGSYRKAGKALDEAIVRLEKAYTQNTLLALHRQTFLGQGAGNLQGINSLMELVHRAADYRVLRGMLLLEEGDPARAARYFQQALDMNQGQPWEFECRGIALHYLKHVQAATP
jgi:tetratricopeptide (TPR) repeat protein